LEQAVVVLAAQEFKVCKELTAMLAQLVTQVYRVQLETQGLKEIRVSKDLLDFKELTDRRVTQD
jgi:hypothetical protein